MWCKTIEETLWLVCLWFVRVQTPEQDNACHSTESFISMLVALLLDHLDRWKPGGASWLLVLADSVQHLFRPNRNFFILSTTIAVIYPWFRHASLSTMEWVLVVSFICLAWKFRLDGVWDSVWYWQGAVSRNLEPRRKNAKCQPTFKYSIKHQSIWMQCTVAIYQSIWMPFIIYQSIYLNTVHRSIRIHT